MASASKVTCQYSVIINDPLYCSHDDGFVKWCWICCQKKRNLRLANQDVSQSSPPLQFDSKFDFYDLPIPPYQQGPLLGPRLSNFFAAELDMLD